MSNLDRIKLAIEESIDHLEAAAAGHPGRAGLACACVVRARAELGAREGAVDARDDEGDSDI